MVTRMDEFERAALIQDLADERDAILRDMEERKRRRELDPFAADACATPQPRPHVEKSDPDDVLMYREQENALVTPPETRAAPTDDTPPGIDPDIFEGIAEALALLRGEMRDEFARKLDRRSVTVIPSSAICAARFPSSVVVSTCS